MRVLLVDDLEVNRFLLEEALAAPEVELRSAGGGHEALRIVADWVPDVVLLDLQMPEIDGYETARRLRAASNATGAYVILLSGNREVPEEDAFVRSGADEFLAKPYSLEELRERTEAGYRISRARSGE